MQECFSSCFLVHIEEKKIGAYLLSYTTRYPMTFLTTFLGIEIESCLLCKVTPSHPHLCQKIQFKKAKSKATFFFQNTYGLKD